MSAKICKPVDGGPKKPAKKTEAKK